MTGLDRPCYAAGGGWTGLADWKVVGQVRAGRLTSLHRLQSALENLAAAIHQMEAALEETPGPSTIRSLLTFLFRVVATRTCTKGGKRHETAAWLSWQEAPVIWASAATSVNGNGSWRLFRSGVEPQVSGRDHSLSVFPLRSMRAPKALPTVDEHWRGNLARRKLVGHFLDLGGLRFEF